MTKEYPQNSVFILKTSVNDEDPSELIYSNIDCLNDLFENHLTTQEVSQDALRSYYVDYYLSQVNNGGFLQFIYNSRLHSTIIQCVLEGLLAMNALKHATLLDQVLQKLSNLNQSKLLGQGSSEDFYEFFEENEEKDNLDTFDTEFYALNEIENLTELNSKWLRQLPNLVVLSPEEFEAEVRRRANALPNLEERIAKKLEEEPRYFKLIRALCRSAGHEFECVTAGDPNNEYQGKSAFAWHFLTDQGHHFMVETDEKAMMFNGDTEEKIHEIDSSKI